MKYVVKISDGQWLALQGAKGQIIVGDPAQATHFENKDEASRAIPEAHEAEATVEEFKP